MSLSDIKKQDNAILDNIRKAGIKNGKDAEKLYQATISYIIAYNLKKTPYQANSLIQKNIDNRLRRILRNNQKTFEQFVRSTQRYMARNYSIDFTEAELNNIAKQNTLLNKELSGNTTELKNSVQALLIGNLGKGIPAEQLIKQLKKLYPNYSRYARTIINTGLSRQYTDINVAKFEQTDFNWFTWGGPNDKLTRDEPCRRWVNKKFTKAELSTLRSTKMTLFNCRHNIRPLTDEQAEGYKRGVI